MNRGSCNEELLRGFLSSVLGSRLIGVGSGEVLPFDAGRDSDAMPRQVDILLYNNAFPCLAPARFGVAAAAAAASPSTCACYYPESVLAVIEVKTTLTNQDLRDVCTAAEQLNPIPFFIFAFDSQSMLRTIDTSAMPLNVMSIHTLSHGSLVSTADEDGGPCWKAVLPSQTPALEVFYDALLDVLSAEESLQEVVSVLRAHLLGGVDQDSTVMLPLESALSELDVNADVAEIKRGSF